MVPRIAFLALMAATSCVAAMPARGKIVDAAREQDWPTVGVLLKQRVDVNAADAEGATALFWAAHWGDLETADLLIRSGAHVNVASRYGLTPVCNGNGTMYNLFWLLPGWQLLPVPNRLQKMGYMQLQVILCLPG